MRSRDFIIPAHFPMKNSAKWKSAGNNIKILYGKDQGLQKCSPF